MKPALQSLVHNDLKIAIFSLIFGGENIAEFQKPLCSEFLNRHREEARVEFCFYKSCQSAAKSEPDCNSLHFVFDFAEKVLLPRLLRQPGQMHFITGLKFDLFGVSSSNLSTNFLFGLPEGHWPNEKTANVVVSMLHWTLARFEGDSMFPSKKLLLHADNCSGQNKNRYVIWYLVWRVIVGLSDSVALYFLVAGRTKNVCDGAFGHVKRKLRSSDALVPEDMMSIIQKSASNTHCVSSVDVKWKNWKQYLEQFFKVPSTMRISEPHVFIFTNASLGKVEVKKFSNSDTSITFNLLKTGVTFDAIRSNWEVERHTDSFKSIITPLEVVPSAQHENRKNYLTVNILDRYYNKDADMREKYFLSGKETFGGV